MKQFKKNGKRQVLAAIALSVFMSFMPASKAWAGYGKDVAEKIASYAGLMEAQDLSIRNIESSLLSGEGDDSSFTCYLYSGTRYTIYAFGDSRIDDTDLVVYKKNYSGNWEKVASDVDTSNLCIVHYECNKSGEYKFTVKAYKYKSGYTRGYYGLIIGY